MEKVVQEQLASVSSFQHAVFDVEAAASDLPDGTGPSLADVRAAVAALSRSAQMVQRASEELGTDFKAARHAYLSRSSDNMANNLLPLFPRAAKRQK